MGNELYIGSPVGVVVCIDRLGRAGFEGRFYHFYSKEPVVFYSTGAMLFSMEDLYETCDFPKKGAAPREFINRKKMPAQHRERERIMSEKELLNNYGEQETFIVRVMHRQNGTWQGRITWADRNKTLNFRSVWEMVRMMENALSEEMPVEEPAEPQKW